MKFSVDVKIFEKFPGVEIGVLVITEMDNKGNNEEILKLLRAEEKRQKELLGGVELGSLSEVSIWRQIYKDFGTNPRDYHSSVESLLRRARGGEKPLPQINNLVDLYNYLSIKYRLPAGAEDLDKVEGDIELTFAKGTEKGIYIGSTQEESCYEGEVIYKDRAGFICRRWNWREADRTKIDFDTENCILVIEKATGLDKTNFQNALAEAEKMVSKLLSGKVQTFILTLESNSFEIPLEIGKRASSIHPTSQIKPINPTKSTKPKPVPHQPVFFSQIRWESEDSIVYKLKKHIYEALSEVQPEEVKDLKISDIQLEHPNSENYGDYSTNLAMKFSGKLKMKPVDLAKKLKDKLDVYIIKHQSRSSETDSKTSSDRVGQQKSILEKIEVKPPGFLNLWLRSPFLITLVDQLLKSKESVISSQILSGKKILVEFAHPNTHKEFHIGHLRNISIGESIIRTLESNGAKLFRANYEGDVGLHVAKAIWGIKKLMGSDLKDVKGLTPIEKTPIEKLRRITPPEKAKFLGEGYALGSKAYEEDEKAKKEIIDLNIAIYTNPKEVELWEETRRWSLEYFDTVYKRVGSHFDRLFFESEVEAPGRQIVKDNVKTGIFIQDKDGSIYFPGKKYGLNDCVFVTKEDYATYEGKEIALEELQRKTFPYDLSINNVASEQQNFFQLGYKATEVLYPWHKDRHFHLAYGMVNLKGGKLSSRTGEVITADWLIDRAKDKIEEIMKKVVRKDTSGAEIDEISEKLAVAAVKYSMLRVNPKMGIAFDIEESVSFEGDSGPYLLYTYARCRSVLRKGGNRVGSQLLELPRLPKSLNEEELSLLRTLYRFPEVVTEAARTLSPSIICSFLFDLAQKYNLFYNKHSILNLKVKSQKSKVEGDEDTLGEVAGRSEAKAMTPATVEESVTNFRLFLTHATSQIIKKGLYLLGIETVERM